MVIHNIYGYIIKVFLIAFTFLMTSCSTLGLWNYRDRYYEDIKGFYLVQGKYEVLALGSLYSYKFEIDQRLYDVFKTSKKIDFELEFDSFSVSYENNVDGRFSLSVDKDNLSESEVNVLVSFGFEQKQFNKSKLELYVNISGVRYIGEGTPPITVFEKPYRVQVTLPDNNVMKTAKVVATPAVLVFDLYVMLPIYIGIVFVYSLNGSFK